MKQKLLCIFTLLLTAVTGAWAESWTSGDCTVTLEGTTITVSGTGAMANYEDPSEQPWNGYAGDIETLIIEDGVRSIGDLAFCDCSSVTTITIGSGVTYIGTDAFFSCTAVTDVYCNADPAALTWEELGCDDFRYDGTTIIHVDDADPWYAKFTCVVNGLFRDSSTTPLTWAYNSTTKTLTFSGTESIPSFFITDERPWYDYISEIEKIVINDGVRSIGKYAFFECSALTSVTIPNSVIGIGDYAFMECSELLSVTIPSSVTIIGDNPFSNDIKLTTLTVDAGNTAYKCIDGLLLTIDGKTIVSCEYGRTSITIPSSVTEIGYYAFSEYSSLTNITIPNNVTAIDDGAFNNCENLTTVTIGSGVTYIGYEAFFNCAAVTDVYCFADPDALTWDDGECDDFMEGKATLCHVADATKFKEKWSTGDPEVDVNVTFVGDLTSIDVTSKMADRRSDVYYDLNGRRVMNPTKGIYIVNGQKVIIK